MYDVQVYFFIKIILELQVSVDIKYCLFEDASHTDFSLFKLKGVDSLEI